MKFLCLAYGAEADWTALSPEEQERLLAQDKVIKDQGNNVAALRPATDAWVVAGGDAKRRRLLRGK